MRAFKLIRGAWASAVALLLGAATFGTSAAQSAQQWREFSYSLPGPNWQLVYW
jgi:hypothetical protein